MRAIREVTVFAHGDSEKLSTWSNVPYFFTKTLIGKGIRVNRVDINPLSPVERLYDHTIWRVLNKLKKGYFLRYIHTSVNQWEVGRRIRNAVRKYSDSDAFIFLSFSHTSSGYSDVPVVLFCDWTIEYYFRYFLNREPLFIERYSMKRQDRIIEDADLVISLFPAVTDHMKVYYKNEQIAYLGNVVNSELSVSAAEVIARKRDSKDILFIGNRKYFTGAICLIKAYVLLKPEMPDLRVHIIGMEARHFEELPEGVTCYGYLDKANDGQRDLYYSLLQRAKTVVNTTEKWGAFSSTIEAMHFYTPVITSSYKEFIQTFGEEISFGYYCEPESVEGLRDALLAIFQDPRYESMCAAANEVVKPFTWDVYIDKLLDKMKEL
jgi:glycosyltransferase involved in cell wall biosynthesis